MNATQLSLDLWAEPPPPPPPLTLSSPFCKVPDELLDHAWPLIQPLTPGKERVRLPAGGKESFEVAAYPFGWAVIDTVDGDCCYLGSCMSTKTLTRLLRQFVKQAA